jgi:hypothetical protein
VASNLRKLSPQPYQSKKFKTRIFCENVFEFSVFNVLLNQITVFRAIAVCKIVKFDFSGNSIILHQSRSNFHVVQTTSAKFGLHAGNMNLTKNEEPIIAL